MGETNHGIITTYDVLEKTWLMPPPLKPAVRGHRRLFRKRLKAVVGDRGLYSQANEDWLTDRGVKQVGIPKRGKISGERRRYQRQSQFKRLRRFQAGIESRISLLKRKLGFKRSRLRGMALTTVVLTTDTH